MAEYDIIIKGGKIVDGTRAPAFVGDLGIKDGKIAQIGGLRKSSATQVLDASGLVVGPGFVDLHTHYDSQVQWDPYCTGSGWHGVTSVILGNCGFGFAPCPPDEQARDRLMLALTRNEAIPFEAMKLGMIWDWVTYPEFLDSLDRIPKGVNLSSLVALSPIYAWVMGGYEEAKERRPNESELLEMCRLLHEAMEAGGNGWSAQVLGPNSIQPDFDASPMITDLMTDEEILAFARVLRERDEGSIEIAYRSLNTAMEGQANAGMKFCARVAEAANRPVIFQQVLPNLADPETHREKLRFLEECARNNVRLYGQTDTRRGGYEITFEYYNFWDDRPLWKQVTLGSTEERVAKMQDPELRAALKADFDAGTGPGAGVTDMFVRKSATPGYGHYAGKQVGKIAEAEGKHPVDTLFDMLVRDNLKTDLWAEQRRDRQYTQEIIGSPYTVGGVSDGGAHVKMFGNGNYGTDFLMWMVRDEGLVSLEEAHHKLSYLPAWVSGLRDRGLLREGAAADIIVYDLQKLNLKPTGVAHDLPGGDWRRVQMPEGYRWTLVNGEVTFEDGEATGAMSGKLLRHGKG